jgi:hypothetical protein
VIRCSSLTEILERVRQICAGSAHRLGFPIAQPAHVPFHVLLVEQIFIIDPRAIALPTRLEPGPLANWAPGFRVFVSWSVGGSEHSPLVCESVSRVR